jgi:very-short-patch-repair endonuclease
MPHEFVPQVQRKAAKRLRRPMTDAERKLWLAIRAHRLNGLAFKRQAPIGPYIVDFVSHRAKLVIEVDGGQHAFDENRRRDEARTDRLANRGYRVLRFWNTDVLLNLDGVLTAVYDATTPVPNPALEQR